MKIPETLVKRRQLTDEKVRQLVGELTAAGASEIVNERACVYATGSVGRGEMSERSDLDVFIVRDKTISPPLTNLEEIRLKARLIDVSRKLNFPEFSDDGEYLKSYDVKADLIEKLGSRTEDYENILTARLLLLLESRPILGETVYKRAVEDLVGVYWRDFPQNATNFLPVFLINDILRFWKTLCLNYEERTGDAKTGKRRLLNYKLKYSRMLTCYSAIIHLLAVIRTEKGTVTTEAAANMVSMMPTKRLEFVADRIESMTGLVSATLDNYARFLETCDEDKATLQEKFSEASFKRDRFAEASQFGDAIFKLLHTLGEGSDLFRYIVV